VIPEAEWIAIELKVILVVPVKAEAADNASESTVMLVVPVNADTAVNPLDESTLAAVGEAVKAVMEVD
jgi:hypothetical protein